MPSDRAIRAKQILDDEIVKSALAEMERRAIEEFIVADRWWWGDKRRRIAAFNFKQVRDFRKRLEMELLTSPRDKPRTIA